MPYATPADTVAVAALEQSITAHHGRLREVLMPMSMCGMCVIARRHGVDHVTVQGIWKQMQQEGRLHCAPFAVVAVNADTDTRMVLATKKGRLVSSYGYSPAAWLVASDNPISSPAVLDDATPIHAPPSSPVAAAVYSTVSSTSSTTKDDEKSVEPVVHELVLDPDEYQTFQQDPYLYLGIAKGDSVELDIEIIDKR